jgi:Family of unknown function (DUF6545)
VTRRQRRWAAAAGELDVPVPFELAEFGARLERQRGRPIRLVPWDMAPTGSNGFLCQTAGADYLYYEQQTSPFHQAHIVLTLAGRMHPGEEKAASFTHSLVSEIGPELVELMLDRTASAPITDLEAESFAFRAIERASRRRGRMLSAIWAGRLLRPLWAMLHDAVPEIGDAADSAISGARWRLYRRGVTIRDAALVLRPYRDPHVADCAASIAHAAGLRGDELAATVEAAILSDAARARRTGEPPQRDACAPVVPSWLTPDLDSETAWLVKVARALTAAPLVGERARGRSQAGSASSGRESSRNGFRGGAWIGLARQSMVRAAPTVMDHVCCLDPKDKPLKGRELRLPLCLEGRLWTGM